MPLYTDATTNVANWDFNQFHVQAELVGGEFISEKHIFESSRIKFFRPDIYKHSVTKIEKGNRYVLSFGFLIKDKKKL